MIPDDDILRGGRHPINYFRYCHAQEELREHARGVACDMGYDMSRSLSMDVLLKMTPIASASALSPDELRRFCRMDLALEVVDEDAGIRYFAVEIAFYAEQKDINRALANARLLARFTGRTACAVIAVGRDYRGLPQAVLTGEYPILLDTPDSEQVYLYQLNERNIERAMAELRCWRDNDGY